MEKEENNKINDHMMSAIQPKIELVDITYHPDNWLEFISQYLKNKP